MIAELTYIACLVFGLAKGIQQRKLWVFHGLKTKHLGGLRC